jgi:hypothetical protein
MSTITYDDQEKFIDWMNMSCATPDIFRSIRNWVVQHIRESMVEHPEGDPGVSYVLTPGEIVLSDQSNATGYEFELLISYSRTDISRKTCYLLVNNEGKIANFVYFEDVLSIKKEQA